MISITRTLLTPRLGTFQTTNKVFSNITYYNKASKKLILTQDKASIELRHAWMACGVHVQSEEAMILSSVSLPNSIW